MSVPVIDAWLDEDGEHVWTAHPCADGQIAYEMLPNYDWHPNADGSVSSSVHCKKCGAHQFVNVNGSRWWPDLPVMEGQR